ncbi:liver carboxylesterase-like [Gracilinanus agilis]|uniref:liver carboxylesterase-like n=1 Tax=Gracilinanus agilis TaxID=191870 RepID=UPI001CFDEDE1|nr:liver carboxylesterase-like [Gracilinanus agilis]
MWLLLLVLCYILAFTIQGSQSSAPVVDTKYGKIQGKQVILQQFGKTVNVFLGVPFAKAPLGPLRFAPPQPPETWDYVKNTTTYPPMCAQKPIEREISKTVTNHSEIISLKNSEDCLYLNIYTSADLATKTKLPVMVWIHGGAFLEGSASSRDGTYLSALENVVVVTIQYRLGIFGFYSTGDEYARGNWGYLDQVAALRWIQKNIGNFGGDPSSVTIFGTSSGGICVSALKFFKMDFLGDPTEKIVLPPTVVDGIFFPKSPKELLAEKQFNHIPYIIGINSHEFAWSLPSMAGFPLSEDRLDQETATALLWQSYPFLKIPKHLTPIVTERYLGVTQDPIKKKELFLEMMGDLNFGIPSVMVARFHRASGAPTYMYQFQHQPSFGRNMTPVTRRADHGDEVFFVFGIPLTNERFPEEEKQLSRTMMKYWANFARNGNPNDDVLLKWPVYDKNEEYLQIDITMKTAKKLKDKEVAFWTELLAEKPFGVKRENADTI